MKHSVPLIPSLPLSYWIMRALLLWAALCLSFSSLAHDKTDTVTLYNGDRLTGEILSLLSAELSLKTDAMGTVHIEWKEVASVDSIYHYELRLKSGERFFGTVASGGMPGLIAFEDEDGERSFNWEEVVELRPVEDRFMDRIDLYVSANYAYTKASDVTQTELRAILSYEDEKTLSTLESRTTVSNTDTETTSSSRHTLSRRIWTDRKALYRTVFGGFENNDELGLDSRLTLGGGFGRYFIDSNNRSLVGSAAIQALEERAADGDNRQSLEAVLSAGYTLWRFDTPELNLHLDASLFPSLTESGRLRADTNARLRWELVEDLFWDVSFWGTYDNATVDATTAEFDWGLTTGLGWEF